MFSFLSASQFMKYVRFILLSVMSSERTLFPDMLQEELKNQLYDKGGGGNCKEGRPSTLLRFRANFLKRYLGSPDPECPGSVVQSADS